ncbi:LEAF RUST 10 DISEASE-RESISTANCE LOCUS RECEPTOR-LIKE PROTEIN KINASE-like 2.1 isoform X2 [Pistacia vera]|uniref:LEAF RUST 10 DISEASE-RESISTANCE LOCUS RECEPTOR-LIKE PROTEIN KINASE-like 2.1 isoform X2 n=1 Tax=Pistacia vera TaxID=55513 RepID=UPI001263B596|nr:LEAF RUST 10 DISEASE-RESISTANCE LOCUS RECEPTOR-LIKE PROTEIN KINASE-like 2.1 isoform X2 [Pistacia vera]
MNNNLFPPLVLHYMIFTLFCILIAIPSSYCDDERYEACSQPYNFSCGGSSTVLNLSYPFWGDKSRPECGKSEFQLTCEDDQHPIINFPPQKFRVLDINTSDQTVRISRKDPPWVGTSWDGTVCPERSNVSVNLNQFLTNYSPNVRNLSLFYECTDKSQLGLHNYTCKQGDEDRKGFYTIDDGKSKYFPNLTDTVTCRKVEEVPILSIDALHEIEYYENLDWLKKVLLKGLEVKYEAENILCSACQTSRGTCGSTDAGEFVCFCRDKPYPHACPGMHARPDLFFWYNCSDKPPENGTYSISCGNEYSHYYSFAAFHKEMLVNYSLESCQYSVYAPLNVETGANWLQMNYTEILKIGFVLNWTALGCSNCEASGGRCGFDNSEFLCFCKDKTQHKTCDDGNTLNLRRKLAIGFGAFVGTGLPLLALSVFQLD